MNSTTHKHTIIIRVIECRHGPSGLRLKGLVTTPTNSREEVQSARSVHENALELASPSVGTYICREWEVCVEKGGKRGDMGEFVGGCFV